jgi:transcriptional regulator with XRE-family HTH domain
VTSPSGGEATSQNAGYVGLGGRAADGKAGSVMDAGARRQISELRIALRQQGATTRQVAAAIAERFGVTPQAAFRHAAGLSQAEVAERYNQRWPREHPKTFKHVSYWECWQGPGAGPTTSSRAPSYEDLARLAGLYGCLVDDLLFGPCYAPAVPAAGAASGFAEVISLLLPGGYAERPEDDDDDVGIALRVTVGEGNTTVKLSRRQFTELLAAGGLAAVLPDAALARNAQAGSGSARYYRQLLTAHQSGHHLLDPRAHISALRQTLRGIEQQRAESTSSGLRGELRLVQSEYAEHLSWLYREAGDLGACRRWADRTAGWALESGDTTMATYMMLRSANLALDQGDHQQAAELAVAAQNVSWQIPPVLRGVALAYEARSRAYTGTVAQDQLDQSASLIADGSPENGPAYLRFYNNDFADVQRATCYVDAGTPERAVTILQSKITTLPASHGRDRGVYLARLGAAHAAGQVPDAAAYAGMASLAEARRAASQHVLAELGHLDATLMRQWPGQPKVRQFHDALNATRAA